MSYMPLATQETEVDRQQNQPLLDDYTEDEEFINEAKRRVHRRRLKKRLFCGLLVFGVVVIGACIVITPALISSNKPKARLPHTSKSVLGQYQHAAVASDVTECSQIGRSILEKQGSAVDAAIAALFCMGLADPQSMGIGGGFLMTIYTKKTGQVNVMDAREMAPAAANETMFVGRPELSLSGPLSIAVPGELKGYMDLHARYGKLSWGELVQPSIDMAVNGFSVPKSFAEALQDDKDNILQDKHLKQVYVNPKTGTLYKTGEKISYPALGATLQTIASNPMSFYNGSLMKDIIADIKDRGGIITEEDLRNYQAKLRKPSQTTLRNGFHIYSPPPPGSGPVLQFILQILDGYDFSAKDLQFDIDLVYHRLIESFKFAYAKRTFLGDEDFVNVKQLVANLTSPAFADEIRKMIWDNTTHSTSYYGPVWDGRVKTGTAHLSILAPNGDAVSVTSTVNSRFGSKILGSRTGIVFNNEMDDFSTPNETNAYELKPSPANFIEPGKRPLSSMCPAIVLDESGEVIMVVGAAGGSRITTTTAMVMAFVMWFGENIKQAIDEVRLHHQLLPATAYCEPDFPQYLVGALEKFGHNMTDQVKTKSVVQGIVREKSGLIQANCDYRKGGAPDGY